MPHETPRRSPPLEPPRSRRGPARSAHARSTSTPSARPIPTTPAPWTASVSRVTDDLEPSIHVMRRDFEPGLDDETLLRSFSKSTRQRIRAAEQAGVTRQRDRRPGAHDRLRRAPPRACRCGRHAAPGRHRLRRYLAPPGRGEPRPACCWPSTTGGWWGALPLPPGRHLGHGLLGRPGLLAAGAARAPCTSCAGRPSARARGRLSGHRARRRRPARSSRPATAGRSQPRTLRAQTRLRRRVGGARARAAHRAATPAPSASPAPGAGPSMACGGCEDSGHDRRPRTTAHRRRTPGTRSWGAPRRTSRCR